MRTKAGLLVTVLLVALGVALPAADAVTVANRQWGEYAIDTGQDSALGDVSRYEWVVLQSYEFGRVPDIKASAPDTLRVMYMQGGTTNDTITETATARQAHATTALSYGWVEANHPDWFLHTTDGQEAVFEDGGSSYRDYHMMDIGNPDYQRAVANKLEQEMAKIGWQGIWFDDVNTTPGHGHNTGPDSNGAQRDTDLREYPTQKSFGQAMAAFVAAVGDQMRTDGYWVMANVACNPWTSDQQTNALTMAGHLDVLNREHYSRYGDIDGPFDPRWADGSNQEPAVQNWIDYDVAVQKAGAHLSGIDYGYNPSTDEDLQTKIYGKALFDLVWDGRAGSAYMYRPAGVVDPATQPTWFGPSTGAPQGPYAEAGGVYQRVFDKVTVVLNATTAQVHPTIYGVRRTLDPTTAKFFVAPS